MSINEMDARAASYFELMAQIEELQAEAEAIKAAMVEIEQEEITGHGWRATWHNTTTTRLDTKRFKAEQSEIYKAYTVTATGTRFTLNQISA